MFRRSAICLLFLSLCVSARAEHDLPSYSAGEAEAETTTTRATSILNVRPPSAPSSRTIQDIQEALSRTDPGMLDALKEALSEIAQGREVSGAAGEAAMDFLNRIPDEEVGAPVAEQAAEEEPSAEEKEELPGITNTDRLKAEAEKEKANQPSITGVSVPGASIVRLEAPQIPASALPGILKAAESAANPGTLFQGFPYGAGKETEGESLEDGEEIGPDGKSATKGVRRVKSGSDTAGGGSELPSGQGGYNSGRTGTGGSGPTITLMSTKTNGGVPQGKQRLAGAVSSFLGKFQKRAIASLGDKSSGRGGIFERLAAGSGLTVERALATAEKSPAFRKFQQATVEAGMTPVESLGAYYTVLALAWLGTIAFLVYCVRHTPLWAMIRRKKA